MALIEAKDITVDGRVHGVSLSLKRGEVLGLIGPNGAGKSTLLHALAGLVDKCGEVVLDGVSEFKLSDAVRARTLGLLPQTMESIWSLRVDDVVSLGRIPWGDNDAKAIAHAVEKTQITEFLPRKIDELSGGERARVWLARVLAGEPQILLADEPIASLDIHYQLSVMDVLKNYAREDHGVIVAMHDLSLAVRYCHRICLMNHGEIVAIGAPSEVCDESLLSGVYGVPVDVDLERQPPVVLPK